MNRDFNNQIIQGNTLDVLKTMPDNMVDMGATSPPYNKKEKNKGWLVDKVIYENFIDKVSESEYQQNQIDVLNEIYRITKDGGCFFYNHKLRWDRGDMSHPMDWLRKTKWHIRQEIIWDRMIAANIRGWRFWQVEERIYWLHKPDNKNKIGVELKSAHALQTSIWRFAPERNNPHPAPYPLELPTRAIYAIMDNKKDGLILDPYMGSGTTAVAAKLLGHNYLGIEASEEYIKMAQDRIDNSDSEIKNFNQEMEKHKVRKTFKQRKDEKKFTGRFKSNQKPQLKISELF
ncbi:MAG: site-specific DNA-methyltransferase [Gammaproteobacteria bacterium]|nr:MAG: site-specific DNA-methyltransferase [Gammaproteobacteria bacterium]